MIFVKAPRDGFKNKTTIFVEATASELKTELDALIKGILDLDTEDKEMFKHIYGFLIDYALKRDSETTAARKPAKNTAKNRANKPVKKPVKKPAAKRVLKAKNKKRY